MAQDPLENAPLAPQQAGNADSNAANKPDSKAKPDAKSKSTTEPEFIVKSDAQWRRILTRAQYAVTRQKATEPAFSGAYATGHFKGLFVCVDCERAGSESVLFSSQHKFESGTGWPSFYRAINDQALKAAPDYSEAEPRVEVMCRRCGAHLGHVFEDGPPPTGLRFCINSIAIKLKSPDAQTRPKTALKGKSKTAGKAKTGTATTPTSKSSETNVSAKDSSEDSSPAADNAPRR
jgi:peptide-methionine (R)-S-oxide reductase